MTSRTEGLHAVPNKAQVTEQHSSARSGWSFWSLDCESLPSGHDSPEHCSCPIPAVVSRSQGRRSSMRWFVFLSLKFFPACSDVPLGPTEVDLSDSLSGGTRTSKPSRQQRSLKAPRPVSIKSQIKVGMSRGQSDIPLSLPDTTIVRSMGKHLLYVVTGWGDSDILP